MIFLKSNSSLFSSNLFSISSIEDEVLGPILQYRMEEDLPTFFTSNLTIDELESSLALTSNGVEKIKAKRITERIKQLTTSLELISKNRRN